MSSTANRVIKNTGFLYAKMGITMFISLYTTRLILSSLGASDFGIFNIVGGAISMLGFLNAAMASATQRFMSFSEGEGNKDKQKKIFNISFILHFVLSIIIGIILLVAGYLFFNGILNIPEERIIAAKVIYGSLIISTMFTVMTVPYDAVMNAHENMKYYAIVGIFESLLKLLVAFACVYTIYDKLIIYGILMACIPIITLSIMRIYCHKNYDECTIAPKQYWNKELMKEMTAFAGWNFFSSAAAMITNNGIGIVMNMFFGTLINAAQGVSNQICGQLMTMTNSLSKAINPIITKTEGKKDHDKVIKFASTSSKATYFITSLFAIPAIITMPKLLEFWLKDVPNYAIFFAQCQLIISLCEQLTAGYNIAIIASGRIKGISLTKSIVKFSFLPLSFFLFKLDVSIIIVYCIFILIQGVINGLIVPLFYINAIFSYTYFNYIKSTFLPCVIISLLVLFVGLVFNNLFEGLLQLIIVFTFCILSNFIFFFTFSLNKEEKNIVINFKLKIKQLIKHD